MDLTYRRYAPAVFRRARQLLDSEADAQDVVHDVFLSLFERPEQYEGRSSLTSYLYSVTTHACLARIRNAKNRQRLMQTHAVMSDVTAAKQLTIAQLQQLLCRMPEQLAQVAIYAYVDELSRDEIAALLPCSRRQVTNLLQRITAWSRSEEERSCS